MTTCPTPSKRRYATREGAKHAAHNAQIGVGQILDPYYCYPGCEWWHLSKKPSDALPEGTTPDPAVVEQLAALDDTALMGTVADETRGAADIPTRLALRDPRLLTRWRKAIGALMTDADAQLSMRAKEGKTEWRRRTLGFKRALEARRAECADRIAASEEETKAAWLQHAAAREQARQEAIAAKKSAAAQRALAGEVAVQRLIDAHGVEFARYLAEECERIGTPLPDRVAKYLVDAP